MSNSMHLVRWLLAWAAAVSAAKLSEVRVVDREHLMVTVLDGEVTHVDDGLGAEAFTGANQAAADVVTRFAPALDATAAQVVGNWTLKSQTDAQYGSTGKSPTVVHRKTKLNGHAQKAWSGSDYLYESTYTHTLYLRLPHPMQQGAEYTLENAVATNISERASSLTFDINAQVSEAIHVNLVGYHASDFVKAADLHLWMGSGGARNYSTFVGNKVWLRHSGTGTLSEVGTVSLWKQASANDVFWRDQTKSPVWKADFTGHTTPGTYRLVVEGVGASQEFEIAEDIYYEPFKTSVKGFFYMRLGQDSVGGIRPVPRRPLYIPGTSPANTVVYLTTMHPWHAEWETFGTGDKWDLKDQWAAYRKPGNPTNPRAKGGHSDAADWDRHLGHVSIVYDMLLPFVLTGGMIDDDNLGIAESGNGIPDILDEARNEVDFWLDLRDGTGYSHGVNNPNASNVLHQAAPTAVAAWANAANAAMLADCFRIAGNVELRDRYRDSALAAWNHASSLSDPMLDKSIDHGGGAMRGRDLRMTAAAYLFNLTGETRFEDTLAVDATVKTGTSKLRDKDAFDQIWAVAGYLKTPRTVGKTTLWNNMKASVIHQAKTLEVGSIAGRASRRSTSSEAAEGYWLGAHSVAHSMVAHAVTTDPADRRLLTDALVLEADYGLGRNAANLIQMSTATTALQGKRSVEGIYTTGRDDGSPGLHPGHTPYMNLDDWACSMVMGCPSKLYEGAYPADIKTWPVDESYHNSRYVWAHGEFTPQQTMRGKMALYGYLYGIRDSAASTSVSPSRYAGFMPGRCQIRVFDLRGRTVWTGMRTLTSLADLGGLRVGVAGVHLVQVQNGASRTTRRIAYW